MFTIKVLHIFQGHSENDLIISKLNTIMGQFETLQSTLTDINASLSTIQNNAANGLTADQTAQVVSALQTVASTLSAIANPAPAQP